MIPFILGALAAVGLSELSKRNKPKMVDGGGVGSYRNHKVGDMVEVWQFGGRSKIKKIVGFEDKEHNHYILEDEKGNRSHTPKKYIANLSGEYPLMASGGGVGKTYAELYNKIVLAVMKDIKVSREKAEDIVNENEGWLTDMIEYEGETNVTFLADQITTTDEGLYAKGGGVAGKDKPKNVLSLLSKFNKEKPSILLIMIADDVSDEFMRKKFDETITWDKLSDSEKQKYNEDYKINKDKFEKYLMYEFVKLYYSDDKIKNKCKGQSRATINSIKSVMVSLAKKYSRDRYAEGGAVGIKTIKNK
jgi:hypothetical protein